MNHTDQIAPYRARPGAVYFNRFLLPQTSSAGMKPGSRKSPRLWTAVETDVLHALLEEHRDVHNASFPNFVLKALPLLRAVRTQRDRILESKDVRNKCVSDSKRVHGIRVTGINELFVHGLFVGSSEEDCKRMKSSLHQARAILAEHEPRVKEEPNADAVSCFLRIVSSCNNAS